MMQDLSGLQPQPDAAPEAAETAVDTLPGTGGDEPQADSTGEPAKVEETDEQRAERIMTERRVRQERAQRKINARFGELTDTIKQQQRIIEQLAGKPAQPAQPANVDAAPRREDFDSYDEWLRADARYVARQEAQQLARQHQETLTRQQQQALAQLQRVHLAQTFSQRVATFAKTNADFAEVMDSDVDIGADAAEALMEMDDAPAVMLVLHKQPELAERLKHASPRMQGVILGQISASLKSRPPQTSQAPAPGAPVGARPSAPAKTLETAVDYDEFVKLRRKQIAARR